MNLKELSKIKGKTRDCNKQTSIWAQNGDMDSDNQQLRKEEQFFCFSQVNAYTVTHNLKECFALLEIGIYAFSTG